MRALGGFGFLAHDRISCPILVHDNSRSAGHCVLPCCAWNGDGLCPDILQAFSERDAWLTNGCTTTDTIASRVKDSCNCPARLTFTPFKSDQMYVSILLLLTPLFNFRERPCRVPFPMDLILDLSSLS